MIIVDLTKPSKIDYSSIDNDKTLTDKEKKRLKKELKENDDSLRRLGFTKLIVHSPRCPWDDK